MRKDLLLRENEVREWISQELPNAEIARRLACKVDTLKSYYKKWGIEYSGNMHRKNMPHYEQRLPIQHFLNSPTAKSHMLRLRLIEEGLKEAKCEVCGLEKWNGFPIPLELHHIDGNHYNNSLENLQILCPNCHAQTSTYSCRKR